MHVYVCAYVVLRMCLCACVRACVCACVRACIHACIPACVSALLVLGWSWSGIYVSPRPCERCRRPGLPTVAARRSVVCASKPYTLNPSKLGLSAVAARLSVVCASTHTAHLPYAHTRARARTHTHTHTCAVGAVPSLLALTCKRRTLRVCTAFVQWTTHPRQHD